MVKGKLPGHGAVRWMLSREMLVGGAPTLAVVSVRLFKVVLLPDEGLPTRAMSGSRGMARGSWAMVVGRSSYGRTCRLEHKAR